MGFVSEVHSDKLYEKLPWLSRRDAQLTVSAPWQSSPKEEGEEGIGPAGGQFSTSREAIDAAAGGGGRPLNNVL